MKSVRYLDEAREEFLHEVQYFSAVSPALGKRFDEAVQKAEALVARFAEVGSPYKHGMRRNRPSADIRDADASDRNAAVAVSRSSTANSRSMTHCGHPGASVFVGPMAGFRGLLT